MAVPLRPCAVPRIHTMLQITHDVSAPGHEKVSPAPRKSSWDDTSQCPTSTHVSCSWASPFLIFVTELTDVEDEGLRSAVSSAGASTLGGIPQVIYFKKYCHSNIF